METERANPCPRKAILVVEDDEEVAHLLTHWLQQEGFAVYSADNGRSGLNLLSHRSIDLVVTDYAMPGMDGAGLIRAMWGQLDLGSVPVVVISSHREEAVREQCRWMSGFLQKPFKMSQLLDLVSELIGQP